MTREQKIAEAQRLRDEGLSYASIGERLGVTSSAVQKWLKPEWAKEAAQRSNAKRGPAKRAWDREQAGSCPGCGAQLSDPRNRLCCGCWRGNLEDKGRERTERFISLRLEGLLNTEIAEREGVKSNVVAQMLACAGRYGLEVPPPPYWSRAAA